MEVAGDRVGGSGTTFYQFALPLDRAEIEIPPAPGAGQGS
jgi:hypothetical protein